jgi:hypothetical protein
LVIYIFTTKLQLGGTNQKANKMQKNNAIIVFILSVLITACQPKGGQNEAFTNDFLVKTPMEATDGNYGYVNQNGIEIVPIGKYQACFRDTIRTFGSVMTTDNVCMGIDKNGAELYEIYWYDNGPDYIVDNRFRIIQNGKIGYANELGEIVIKPQFQCANAFEDGKARVTNDCKLIKDGEHTITESESWFFINTAGEIIE